MWFKVLFPSNSIQTKGELRVETRDDAAVKKTRTEFDIHDKIAWNFREWTFVVRIELKGWMFGVHLNEM